MKTLPHVIIILKQILAIDLMFKKYCPNGNHCRVIAVG